MRRDTEHPELTVQERRVIELIAWGAAIKEIPDCLVKLYGGRQISVRTVENIKYSGCRKIGVTKDTEISAWWMINHCNADYTLSPFIRLRNSIIGVILFVIMIPQIFQYSDNPALRNLRSRTSRTRIERVERARKEA